MNQIIKYFLDEGINSIEDSPYTWNELGDQFGISGNAARKTMSRFWKKNPTLKHKPKNFKPKVLLFDLETAPLSAYVWRLWKQNVNPIGGQLRSEWFLLTYSAKWLFEPEMISGKLTKEEVIAEDDYRLVQELWNLLNEADVVIAHYGKGFDIPMINGRFLKHGLKPPMPYKVIDTKLHASKQFALPSYKLDYLGEYLGLGNKIKTEFELWVNCLKGNEEALLKMSKYNDQDVYLLEDVYLAIRPYIQPHPNLGLYIEEDIECCPSCTSTNLSWEGKYVTTANTYNAFRCNDCGSVGRSRLTNMKRPNSTRAIPSA